MECPYCNAENDPDALSCRDCATELARVCSSCRASNAAAAVTCSACGGALVDERGEPIESTSRAHVPAWVPVHLGRRASRTTPQKDEHRIADTATLLQILGLLQLAPMGIAGWAILHEFNRYRPDKWVLVIAASAIVSSVVALRVCYGLAHALSYLCTLKPEKRASQSTP